MRIVFGCACHSVWVGEHVRDLRGADAEGERPNAPCVEVWQSPQTSDEAGLREALLGPDDVHDALARRRRGRKMAMPCAAAVVRERLDLAAQLRMSRWASRLRVGT